jgi:hypothetical protein
MSEITVTPVSLSTSPAAVSAPAPTESIQPLAAAAPDAPTEAAKPEAKELASHRFAQAAAKEAKLQAEREQLKAEREAIKNEREQLTPLQAEIKAFQEAKADKLKALALLGVSMEELNDAWIANELQSPGEAKASEVDRKLEAYKAELEAEKRKAFEAEKAQLDAQNQKVIEEFHSDVLAYVESNKEKYELTTLYKQEAEVIRVIEQHYAESNEVMSKDTAAELVEKYLESLVEQAIPTKKFQAKASPQPQAEQKQAPAKSSASTRTITHSITPASAPVHSISNVSDSERLSRAVAKYHELARTK